MAALAGAAAANARCLAKHSTLRAVPFVLLAPFRAARRSPATNTAFQLALFRYTFQFVPELKNAFSRVYESVTSRLQ